MCVCCEDYGSPKLRLRRPDATLSRPSRIGTRNYGRVFVGIFRILSGIQTFHEPLATTAKTVSYFFDTPITNITALVLEPGVGRAASYSLMLKVKEH